MSLQAIILHNTNLATLTVSPCETNVTARFIIDVAGALDKPLKLVTTDVR